MAEPIEVNDNTWQELVLDSDTPVMVDFWAEWCGPCKMIAPAVQDMAVDYDGQLKVAKLDVDNSPNTAMQYGVRSIPALIFFKGGQPVDQIVGAVPKGALKKKVDSVLGSQTVNLTISNKRRRRSAASFVCDTTLVNGSGWGPVALADFKSVMPRDERGRWVRLPRTPARQHLGTKSPDFSQ